MKKIIYILLAASVSLFSCKKDSSNPTPISKEVNLLDFYSQEGFIKGTITGKTSANENFTHSFNYELVERSYMEIDPNEGDTIYNISIGRGNANASIKNALDEYMNLTFSLKKDKSTLLNLGSFAISSDIKMQDNTITRFEGSYYGPGNGSTLNLSNVKFNPSTGSISADYLISIGTNNNRSGNLATVAGSFSSMNTNFVYRKAN